MIVLSFLFSFWFIRVNVNKIQEDGKSTLKLL